MSPKPEFQKWQDVMDLVAEAAEHDKHGMLLTMLMTPDERDAIQARVNIFNELLKGNLSQRQISQMLGVGIATITRGSNELKNKSDIDRAVLEQLLKNTRE